jgi:NAD(P)-dependent dehydrogenase (short-subunit alcohol dehydrogenase family)
VKEGCTRLVVTDIVERTLNETVELAKAANSEIQIKAVIGDLRSEDFVEELVSEVVKTFDGLTYAVNAAGITGKSLATDEMEFEHYREVQRINIEALWLCERAEIRVMLEQDLVDGYPQRRIHC